MSKIFKIIKREFVTKVFTRGFIISTIIGPFIMIGIILAPAFFVTVSDDQPVKIGLVDYSSRFGHGIQYQFPDTLQSGLFSIQFIHIPVDAYHTASSVFKEEVESGSLSGILIIPSDITQNDSLVYLARSVGDIELVQRLRTGISEMRSRQRLNEAGLEEELIRKLNRDVNIHTVKIVKGEEQTREFGQEYLTALIFLIILYMTIIIYGSSIMRSVIEEKTSRIIEILLSSASTFQLMMGKLIGVGSVGLVQYLIWVMLGSAVFFIATYSIPLMAGFIQVSPDIILYFIIFFLIGYFTFSTLYAAVGAVCSDMQDAQSLSAPVTLLIILPFMISFMVIRTPDSEVAQILSFTPFFTPLIMFLRILLIKPPVTEIWLSITVNVLSIILITWLASRIFRIGILLYGKRPTVPEIFRWLRYR